MALASGFSEKRLGNIDAHLQRLVDNKEVAGVGALVIRHGETAYRKSFGYGNIEKGQKLENDAIYRIFSMSKTFTAMAIMTLYEKGLFKLSDPIYEFLPAFKDAKVAEVDERGISRPVPPKSPITVEHVLTMTSGIPYAGEGSTGGRVFMDIMAKRDEDTARGVYWNAMKMMEEVARVPLCFHPGEYWMYGFSMDVVGGLVNAISGKSLGRYLEDIFYKPLGLKDTGFYLPPEKYKRMAGTYRWSPGKLVLIPETLPPDSSVPGMENINNRMLNDRLMFNKVMLDETPPFESGGAGMLSTLDDIGAFAKMLLQNGKSGDDRMLSRKTVDLIRRKHVMPHIRPYSFEQIAGYGYGLGVRTLIDPVEAGINGSVGEWAWDGAAGTWYAIDPAEDLVMVFMIQRFPGGHSDLPKRFAQTVYGALDD
jgi:CubicO group peptidase (beta-lactamase class C family)